MYQISNINEGSIKKTARCRLTGEKGHSIKERKISCDEKEKGGKVSSSFPDEFDLFREGDGIIEHLDRIQRPALSTV